MTRARRTKEKDSAERRRLGAGLRCAIYTRKSSDEGLEQDFNSLHAQREACEAFILSQKHEGWSVLPSLYDDGGYSGGTIERPAIERLLEDVRAGRIDVVVVYKVDRLTRSLADFAKIVEIFDGSGMGRLTLNVLLSFAQFEREVTGERIRDKIAASKKKGMWMGGFVPLGYEPKDRSLVINEVEAETVRTLFRLYLSFGNVRLVKEEVDRLGLRSKLHSGSNGKTHGGVSFSRGAIYKILSNPIYVGEIDHKGERHPGAHPAIVDRETWEAVQKRLQENAVRKRTQVNAQSPSLLAGLIFDEAGEPLTPSHANKKGRRYRYYVSRSLLRGVRSPEQKAGGIAAASSWRVPATDIETLVLDAVNHMLRDRTDLMERLRSSRLDARSVDQALFAAGQLANELEHAADPVKRAILADLVDRVEISSEAVTIRVDGQQLLSKIANGDATAIESSPVENARFDLRIPVRLKRCGSERKLIFADRAQPAKPDRTLISNLARGFAWVEELRTGASGSLGAIAERESISPRFIRRCCDLVFLPTKLIETILAGGQSVDISSEVFKQRYPLPIGWDDQWRALSSGASNVT